MLRERAAGVVRAAVAIPIWLPSAKSSVASNPNQKEDIYYKYDLLGRLTGQGTTTDGNGPVYDITYVYNGTKLDHITHTSAHPRRSGATSSLPTSTTTITVGGGMFIPTAATSSSTTMPPVG